MGWLAQGLDGRFGSGLFAAVCGVVLIGAGARAGSPTFTELYDAQVRDGAELFGERRGAIDRAIDLAEVGAERRVVTMQTPHNPDDKYARIYLRDRALLDDGSLRIRNYELNEGESGVVLVGEWITDEAELFVALPELVRLHALYGADADREGGTIRSVHFTHGVFAEGIDWFAFNEAHEAWFDATRAGDPDADRLAPEPQSPRIMLMESYIFQFDWIVSRRKDTAAHEAARDARNLSITLFDEPSDPRQLNADFGATPLVTGDWLTTTMQRLARDHGQQLMIESGVSGASTDHGRQFIEAVMHRGMHAGAPVMDALLEAIEKKLDEAGADRRNPSTRHRGDDLVGFDFHYETEQLRGFCRVTSYIDLRGDARIVVTIYEHPK